MPRAPEELFGNHGCLPNRVSTIGRDVTIGTWVVASHGENVKSLSQVWRQGLRRQTGHFASAIWKLISGFALGTQCRSVDPRESATRIQSEAECSESDAGDTQNSVNPHRRDVAEACGNRETAKVGTEAVRDVECRVVQSRGN